MKTPEPQPSKVEQSTVKHPVLPPNPSQPIPTELTHPNAHEALSAFAQPNKPKGVLKRILETSRKIGRERTIRKTIGKLLHNDAELLRIKHPDVAEQVLRGFFEGQDWVTQRLRMKPLRLELTDEFVQGYAQDEGPQRGKEIVLGSLLFVSTEQDVEQNNGKVKTVAEEIIPPLTPKQIGEATGVEEALHCAQIQGLTDAGIELVHFQMTDLKDNIRNLTPTPDEYIRFMMQPHERQAAEYKWMYFQEQVMRGELTENPFTKLIQTLGLDTEELERRLSR